MVRRAPSTSLKASLFSTPFLVVPFMIHFFEEAAVETHFHPICSCACANFILKIGFSSKTDTDHLHAKALPADFPSCSESS